MSWPLAKVFGSPREKVVAMADEKIWEEINELISRMEAQLIQSENSVRRLHDLRVALTEKITGQPAEEQAVGQSAVTNYDRIVKFLRDRGNQGQTTKAISKATGL